MRFTFITYFSYAAFLRTHSYTFSIAVHYNKHQSNEVPWYVRSATAIERRKACSHRIYNLLSAPSSSRAIKLVTCYRMCHVLSHVTRVRTVQWRYRIGCQGHSSYAHTKSDEQLVRSALWTTGAAYQHLRGNSRTRTFVCHINPRSFTYIYTQLVTNSNM